MCRNVLILFSLNLILLLLSCAPRRVELPEYEYVDIKELIYSKNNISRIDSKFSIVYEKDDTRLKGEGILNISKNGDLNLRVYSFGFLAFELISENGIIKNTPIIDKKSASMLAKGLKDCFFWWDLIDFEIEENGEIYILKEQSRELWVDRKTILPLKQLISLTDGRKLQIYYEEPMKNNEIWFPSKIKIEHLSSSITLEIKDILFSVGV